MANNYRISGYERKKNDKYTTIGSQFFINLLFEHWKPEATRIHEPCCGDGDMVSAIKKHGYIVSYNDIELGLDYLDNEEQYECIVTNPPYGTIAPRIVRHAIAHSDCCAFLLPHGWDAAGGRSDLFGVDSSLYMVLRVNQRIPWIEGTNQGGKMDYSWFIWDKEAIGKEQITRYGPK